MATGCTPTFEEIALADSITAWTATVTGTADWCDFTGTSAADVYRDICDAAHLALFMGHRALSAHWPPLLAAVRARS